MLIMVYLGPYLRSTMEHFCKSFVAVNYSRKEALSWLFGKTLNSPLCFTMSKTSPLTHFQPLFHFYAPGNIIKPEFFWCFQGKWKWNIGWKWVKQNFLFTVSKCKRPISYSRSIGIAGMNFPKLLKEAHLIEIMSAISLILIPVVATIWTSTRK